MLTLFCVTLSASLLAVTPAQQYPGVAQSYFLSTELATATHSRSVNFFDGLVKFKYQTDFQQRLVPVVAQLMAFNFMAADLSSRHDCFETSDTSFRSVLEMLDVTVPVTNIVYMYWNEIHVKEYEEKDRIAGPLVAKKLDPYRDFGSNAGFVKFAVDIFKQGVADNSTADAEWLERAEKGPWSSASNQLFNFHANSPFYKQFLTWLDTVNTTVLEPDVAKLFDETKTRIAMTKRSAPIEGAPDTATYDAEPDRQSTASGVITSKLTNFIIRPPPPEVSDPIFRVMTGAESLETAEAASALSMIGIYYDRTDDIDVSRVRELIAAQHAALKELADSMRGHHRERRWLTSFGCGWPLVGTVELLLGGNQDCGQQSSTQEVKSALKGVQDIAQLDANQFKEISADIAILNGEMLRQREAVLDVHHRLLLLAEQNDKDLRAVLADVRRNAMALYDVKECLRATRIISAGYREMQSRVAIFIAHSEAILSSFLAAEVGSHLSSEYAPSTDLQFLLSEHSLEPLRNDTLDVIVNDITIIRNPTAPAVRDIVVSFSVPVRSAGTRSPKAHVYSVTGHGVALPDKCLISDGPPYAMIFSPSGVMTDLHTNLPPLCHESGLRQLYCDRIVARNRVSVPRVRAGTHDECDKLADFVFIDPNFVFATRTIRIVYQDGSTFEVQAGTSAFLQCDKGQVRIMRGDIVLLQLDMQKRLCLEARTTHVYAPHYPWLSQSATLDAAYLALNRSRTAVPNVIDYFALDHGDVFSHDAYAQIVNASIVDQYAQASSDSNLALSASTAKLNRNSLLADAAIHRLSAQIAAIHPVDPPTPTITYVALGMAGAALVFTLLPLFARAASGGIKYALVLSMLVALSGAAPAPAGGDVYSKIDDIRELVLELSERQQAMSRGLGAIQATAFTPNTVNYTTCKLVASVNSCTSKKYDACFEGEADGEGNAVPLCYCISTAVAQNLTTANEAPPPESLVPFAENMPECVTLPWYTRSWNWMHTNTYRYLMDIAFVTTVISWIIYGFILYVLWRAFSMIKRINNGVPHDVHDKIGGSYSVLSNILVRVVNTEGSTTLVRIGSSTTLDAVTIGANIRSDVTYSVDGSKITVNNLPLDDRICWPREVRRSSGSFTFAASGTIHDVSIEVISGDKAVDTTIIKITRVTIEKTTDGRKRVKFFSLLPGGRAHSTFSTKKSP